MKSKVYLLIVLFFAVLSGACKKNNADNSELGRSYRAWMNFKAASGDNYQYMVNTLSWIGMSTETIITVQSGKPVHRAYVRKMRDQSGQLVTQEEWEEDTSSLSSHRDGFTPQTLDEIYHQAKTEWLTERKDVLVYFETENDGMISLCGYVPIGCMDDCFRGVKISFIEKI